MRKRKIRIGRLIILLTILIVLFSGSIFLVGKIWDMIAGGQFGSSLRADDYDPEIDTKFDIELNSRRYLMSKETADGNITVYSSGKDEMFYPASLTKLLTLAVVLDHVDDYSTVLVTTADDIEGLYEANASVLGLNAGDTISIDAALYGLMLPSAADCANILSRYVETVAGSDFVNLMNEKAAAIGMNASHFTNPTGLFDTENYSTLSDMNTLMAYLWQNEKAREIITTSYSEKDGYYFYATSYRFLDTMQSDNAKVIGGKTGYTYESQYNYACVIEENDGTIWFLITGGATTLNGDDSSAYAKDVHNILNTYFN